MYHTMCYMFIYRYWFKGSFSLMISMGVTWIFGLLSLHKFLLPFIYLFAIFTSLQVSVLWDFACALRVSYRVYGYSFCLWCYLIQYATLFHYTITVQHLCCIVGTPVWQKDVVFYYWVNLQHPRVFLQLQEKFHSYKFLLVHPYQFRLICKYHTMLMFRLYQ